MGELTRRGALVGRTRLQPAVIRGTNVLLRELVDADVNILFASYFASVAATKFLSRGAHTGVAQTKAVLGRMCRWENSMPAQSFGWIVARICDDYPVGIFYAMPRGSAVEVHYGIGTPFWNLGLATEAGKLATGWLLEQRSVRRVWTAVDDENIATVRVLEKVGFEKQCRLKNWAVLPAFGKTPRDATAYCLLKPATANTERPSRARQ